MNKIYNLFSLVIVALIFTTSSCEFGDTNINKATPADVSAQAIVPAAQSGMAFAVGGEMVRINGLFMQHFEGINAQQFDNYQYLVKASDMDGVWRRMYANSLNPFVTILQKAEEDGSNHTAAMAKVMIAHGLGSLADMFGDIPYTDAFEGLEDNFFPTYDSQEDIYTSIQLLLDEAITAFEGDPGAGPSFGAEDLIYGEFSAQTELWVKAAHSLKAKYYIHTSKVDANSYSNALAELPDAISANFEDFQFNFGPLPNEANPQYQFTQDRGGNLAIDDFFFDLLNTLADPRRIELLTADPDEPSGFNKDFDSDTYYTTINSPVIFMSYTELKFIEAEAELMGNNDVVAAEAALAEAISASLIKITGADDAGYVAANSDLQSLATQDEQLEQIMTQKYIALYSHGLESWTDFRRTGYPAITPVPGGNNAFNLNGEVPRRLPYPQTEIDLNADNVPISSPDFQNPFWWDAG